MEKITKDAAIKRFNEIYDAIEKAYVGYAKAQGLNALSFVTLRDIYESETTLNQKELSEKHAIPKQVINNIIKNFLADGLVRLEESADRRFKKISLTEKGHAFAKQIFKPIEYVENHIWDDIAAEDIARVVKTIETYAEKINALNKCLKLN